MRNIARWEKRPRGGLPGIVNETVTRSQRQHSPDISDLGQMSHISGQKRNDVRVEIELIHNLREAHQGNWKCAD